MSNEMLNDKFLLNSDFAVQLWEKYAKPQPIIDFHCHLEPREVFENRPADNITRLWINSGSFGDHYKWRLMRAHGVPEEKITGSASDFEKFEAFCSTMEGALGNPIYEWSHLELKRFFRIDTPLSKANAKLLWDEINAKLKLPEFSPRGLIANSNVKVFVTTDDPVDDLRYHQDLAKEETRFKMLPGWRPDNITNIHKNGFREYIEKLETLTGAEILTFADVKAALVQRMDFFAANGCNLCDHGADTFYYNPCTEAQANEILRLRLRGTELTQEQLEQWFTAVMIFLAKEYAKRDWVMQIHANCRRDVNTPYLKKIGPNTGFDTIADNQVTIPLTQYFDALEQAAPDGAAVPRTMLYSLNNKDWLPMLTIATSHLGNGVKQKFQLGSAWWFNDTFTGMLEQLTYFGDETLLGNFVGMLTDSRSFLSYTRHEYFRRILCEYMGRLHAAGRIPDDITIAGKLVADVSYNNAKEYFGF
ncbi:uronate isomerase [Actinomycetota bacterium]|nr:uronate isomerase [Actinomycetota bacterium]